MSQPLHHPDIPRVIAIDMDGTLVHPGGYVTEANQAALRAARSAGARIVIATGRRHSYAMKILRKVDLDPRDIVLSSNGTVARTMDGELLLRRSMHWATARWLCSRLDDFRDSLVLTFDLLGENGEDLPGALVLEELDELHGSIRSWMESNAQAIQRVHPIENALVEGSEAGQPIQAMLCGTMERMHRAEAMLASAQLACAQDHRLALYRTEYPGRDLCILDILPAGCSKGSGLRELLHRSGLTENDLMCLGDNYNDLPMLELARWPVLMGNAPSALLKMAKDRGWPVSSSHEQDAVAAAIHARLASSQSATCIQSEKDVDTRRVIA